jgi:hypothetical protein
VTIAGRPLEPDRSYRLAVPNYLVLGGDGYEVFADQRVLVAAELGPSVASALETFVSGRTIAPAVDGRITIVR